MDRTIFCKKLNHEAEGLDTAPFPGELGQKLFDNISKPAWSLWLTHQTMLINEYHLNLIDPKSREFLRTEMDKFLFGDGAELPAGYEPKK